MRIFKNRIFIAVVCILFAAAVAFLGIPALNGQTRATVVVLRVKQAVPAETQITADMLATVEVGDYGLPDEVITDAKNCVGLYAAVTLLPTDNLTAAKFVAELEHSDKIGTRTDKLNISIALPSLSAGVSGKLAVGDVVRVYAAVQGEIGYTVVQPDELSCMEVVAVVNNKAADASDAETSDATIAAAVTLVATDRQARTLVGLQSNGTVHLALIGRDAAAVDMLTTFNTERLPEIETAIAEAERLEAERLAAEQAVLEAQQVAQPEGGDTEWQ